MSRLKRRPRFLRRARTVGVKVWTCALCGAIDRTTVNARSFRLRCAESSCRARYVFGEVFYLLPGGGHIAPPSDTLLPVAPVPAEAPAEPVPVRAELASAERADTIPVAVLAEERYHSCLPVNRLVIVKPHT
jgi:hypothetical protein